MPSIEDQIKAIEEEILNTQKNKATEHHIGKLKAKIARLKGELELRRVKRVKGGGFQIKKEGDATVVLVGYPSVGKSSLLKVLTGRNTEIADYPFTTLDVIPGILKYKGVRIQILDLPGLIKDSSKGKGRGREVMGSARQADLIIMMGDIYQNDLGTLKKELYNFGIRLNTKPPRIKFEPRERGGISILTPRNVGKGKIKVFQEMARQFGYINGVFVFSDFVSEEEFLDYLSQNRVYIPTLEVINKADLMGEDKKRMINELKEKGVHVISVKEGWGMNELMEGIFRRLSLIRVYLKPRGGEVDRGEPMILKKGATVKDVCLKLHKDFIKRFHSAQISGSSVRFNDQRVGLNHVLKDGDVITIILRKRSRKG